MKRIKFLLIAVMVILIVGTYVVAGQIVKPYTFSPNTPAKSSEVNANFDVLYNAVNNNAGIPQGVIVMWSGSSANIPSGWALCNGSNGTPNLMDRFVVGSGNIYPVGTTGGEATHVLTVAEMPIHTHIQNEHSHQEQIFKSGGSGGYVQPTGSSANNSSPVTTNMPQTLTTTATNQNAGGGAAHNNMPPYYALCFIMKL